MIKRLACWRAYYFTSWAKSGIQRDPSLAWLARDAFVDRRKLDFVGAAKLIPWVDVRGEEVDFRRRTWSDGRFTARVKAAGRRVVVYCCVAGSMCHPCRGFLVYMNSFSQRFRAGLHCGVPSGTSRNTELDHYRLTGRVRQHSILGRTKWPVYALPSTMT